MRRLETFDWWPDLIAQKDTLSLRELAQKFDVTPGAISSALRREGVGRSPAPPGPRNPRRKAGDDALPPEPGEAPVKAKGKAGRPAKAAAGSPRSNSKDAKLMALWDELGKAPDRDIAERAGTSVRTVASFRARHAVPAYTGPRRSRSGAPAKAPAKVASPGKASSGQQAWAVVLRSAKGDATRVVIADGVVEAAGAAASGAAGAKVVSVSWVGDLL